MKEAVIVSAVRTPVGKAPQGHVPHHPPGGPGRHSSSRRRSTGRPGSTRPRWTTSSWAAPSPRPSRG